MKWTSITCKQQQNIIFVSSDTKKISERDKIIRQNRTSRRRNGRKGKEMFNYFIFYTLCFFSALASQQTFFLFNELLFSILNIYGCSIAVELLLFSAFILFVLVFFFIIYLFIFFPVTCLFFFTLFSKSILPALPILHIYFQYVTFISRCCCCCCRYYYILFFICWCCV